LSDLPEALAPPLLEDTTLREGEQSPHVAFSLEEKLEIGRSLADLGIKALEVGTPAMGGPEREAIEALVSDGLDVRLIGWNRARQPDIEVSRECGLRAIHIGLPASDHHIERKFGRSREWVIETMRELVVYAKSVGLWVSVSAEDVGRADLGFIVEYAKEVQLAGADRLRLSDTVGVLTPFSARSVFERLSRAVEIPLQAHMHNDFGLATANTLAAVEGGAQHVHVTVNGLGERAGIAPLDEVALGLKLRLGRDVKIRLESLSGLCRYVARASGRPIPANKPITGSAIFEHESGIHVDGVLKVADAFEPFPPELVGGERRIVIGKHSGSGALRHVLATQGVDPDPERIGAALAAIRYEAVKRKRSISPAEVVEIYERVVVDR
jgi:homocitrate synthase NifV